MEVLKTRVSRFVRRATVIGAKRRKRAPTLGFRGRRKHTSSSRRRPGLAGRSGGGRRELKLLTGEAPDPGPPLPATSCFCLLLLFL